MYYEKFYDIVRGPSSKAHCWSPIAFVQAVSMYYVGQAGNTDSGVKRVW